MGKSSRRQLARKQRQDNRAYIAGRDLKDIMNKFPNSIKAWVTFGGRPGSGNSLESRMREEARGGIGLSKRLQRSVLKNRRDTELRLKAKIHFEKMQKLNKERKEQSKMKQMGKELMASAAKAKKMLLRKGVA